MSDSKNPRFIKLEDAAKITQLGKSTILAWEAQGKFPAAVRLSPSFRVWLESDVHEWMMSKANEAKQMRS
jgi:predicted DNA-binding transcriptional regulator AlpA